MFGKKEATINTKNIETIIGPSVKVTGDFTGEGDLVIEGILVGTLNTKNNLKIGSGALVEASIKANNAYIAGRIKGNITIKGRLELTGSAIIVGDIKASVLSIESGAVIQGNVLMPLSGDSHEDHKVTSKKDFKKQEHTQDELVNELPLES
jgi:cytoskeletal protein CcmA (bactofilin family)